MDFATKVRKIDPCSGILDFLPLSEDFDDNKNSVQQPENNISHLYVFSQAKMYVKANLDKLSENNLLNFAEEFLKTLTFSDNDRMIIEKATVGQHKNKTWHKMRHLLVTGKKIKSLYTRQKTLEKNPLTDVSLTVKNLSNKKNFKKGKCTLKP